MRLKESGNGVTRAKSLAIASISVGRSVKRYTWPFAAIRTGSASFIGNVTIRVVMVVLSQLLPKSSGGT